MSTPQSEATSQLLLERLVALQAAEDEGDLDAVMRLEVELIEERLVDRVIHGVEPTTLDGALCLSLAASLRARDHTGPAALLYGAAIDYGERAGDSMLVTRARLGAVHCLIARLDLEYAAEVLALVPEGDEALDPERRYARGRLHAALGKLSSAVHCLSPLLLGSSVAEAAAAEVAILLAELHLDRGEFDEVQALRQRWAARGASASSSLRWRVLDGISNHLQGRLGTAERILREAMARPHPLSAKAAVDVARWHLAQVLGLLNRVDEAQAMLDALGDAPHLGDHDALRETLVARKSPAPNPTRRRVRHGHYFERSGRARITEATVATPPTRKHERVALDWAEHANRLHLHLHRGELDHAIALLGWLTQWSESIESQLVWAHREHLIALVAEACSQWNEAFVHARAALEAYERLGMLTAQWNLSRLCCRVLAMFAEGSSHEIEEHRERSTSLLTELCAGLDADARRTFLLNKWTQVEERISAACRECPPDDDRAARAALRTIIDHRLWGTGERGVTQRTSVAEREGNDMFVLAELHAEMWRGRGSRRGVSRRLAPRMLRDDAAVAYYVVLPDRVELFLICGGCCRRIELEPVSKIELWDLVRRAINKLRHYEWSPGARDPSALARALGLARIAEHLPPTVERLFIVPDGALAHVPFAALPYDSQPLVMRFAIAFVPRWQWARDDPFGRRRFRAPLGVATGASQETAEVALLPAIADELAGIARVATKPPRLLLEEGATKPEVLKALEASDLVHVACHGRFDPEQPHRSGLRLHDAWLTLDDFKRVDLRRLRLAILAACEGASSVPLPGAEAIGIPTAFLLRGASAVVSATWEIPHDATGELMRDLYSAMEKQGPMDALSATQRAWYERGRSTPTWGSYVLHVRGIPRPWWAGLWPPTWVR